LRPFSSAASSSSTAWKPKLPTASDPGVGQDGFNTGGNGASLHFRAGLVPNGDEIRIELGLLQLRDL
jgi:hypothetical protein